MSIRITWNPSTESDIASYDLNRALGVDGSFSLLINVPHNLVGANFDTVNHVFFYIDSSGTADHYYELIAIDQAANRSVPSTPFKPLQAPPTLPDTVKVDQNYGTPAALRYQTNSGVPIQGATIRIYKRSDFEVGNTDIPIAVTTTDANGNWVHPVNLLTGFTYTVQFSKESQYGPDKTEIIV
jgi:hypothetical protein